MCGHGALVTGLAPGVQERDDDHLTARRLRFGNGGGDVAFLRRNKGFPVADMRSSIGKTCSRATSGGGRSQKRLYGFGMRSRASSRISVKPSVVNKATPRAAPLNDGVDADGRAVDEAFDCTKEQAASASRCSPAAISCPGSCGVVRTLSVSMVPRSVSTAAKSANVPPISTPTIKATC